MESSSTSSRYNRSRVSMRQLDILCDFLSAHPEIAKAHNRSLTVKDYARRKWTEIANTLNSLGDGAHKDWRSWSKYWVDYKAKIKHRVAAVRSSLRQTGGGPVTEKPLTDIEKRILRILGEDLGQGIPGVRIEPILEPIINVEPLDIGLLDVQIETSNIEVEQDIEHPYIDHSYVNTTDPPVTTEPPAALPTRRQRRGPTMSREAARTSLVGSSQLRADASVRSAEAAIRSAEALDQIAQNIVELRNSIIRIER